MGNLALLRDVQFLLAALVIRRLRLVLMVLVPFGFLLVLKALVQVLCTWLSIPKHSPPADLTTLIWLRILRTPSLLHVGLPTAPRLLPLASVLMRPVAL